MQKNENFRIHIIVSVISSIVPPQRNLTITLCLVVVGRSSLIPDIIEPLTFVTVPFRLHALGFSSFALLFFCFYLNFLGILHFADHRAW